MTISQQTREYIEQNPAIRSCLSSGLINHSALARLICEEVSGAVDSFDAVQAACRRYRSDEIALSKQELKARALVHQAKLMIRTKVAVSVVEKGDVLQKALSFQQVARKQSGLFRLIEGENTFSVICSEEYLGAIRQSFGRSMIDSEEGLTQLSLIFSKQITTTIGVCGYLYKLLAEHQINIRDEMSCWRDVMLIISSEDLAKAIDVLGGQRLES